MAEVALAARTRPEQGSAHSRRLRKEGRIPAVLYGHSTEPIALSVDGKDLRTALTTSSGLNALLQLDIDGTKHLAFTRDMQRHPVRGTVSHVDFLVVSRNEEITASVPLTFTGEPEAVTKMGGVVEHQLTSIEVTATVSTLPGHIDFDISALELDGTLRISDISLPKGVVATHDPDEAVVTGRRSTVEAEAAADDAAAESASEESAVSSSETADSGSGDEEKTSSES